MFREGKTGIIIGIITLAIVVMIFIDGDSPMQWWQILVGVLIILAIILGIIRTLITTRKPSTDKNKRINGA